jgi:hypothetical protein
MFKKIVLAAVAALFAVSASALDIGFGTAQAVGGSATQTGSQSVAGQASLGFGFAANSTAGNANAQSGQATVVNSQGGVTGGGSNSSTSGGSIGASAGSALQTSGSGSQAAGASVGAFTLNKAFLFVNP